MTLRTKIEEAIKNDNAAYIKLGGKSKDVWAIVDSEDLELVSAHRWSSHHGYAKNYPVTQTPQKFAITKESWTGHAVVIEQDLGDQVIIRDANYIPYKITRRKIPKSLIKGYLI